VRAYQTSKVKAGRGNLKQTPQAPASVTAAKTDEVTIVISWQDPADQVALTGYNIYRSYNGGSYQYLDTVAPVAYPASTSYIDETLPAGSYTYRVGCQAATIESTRTTSNTVQIVSAQDEWAANTPSGFSFTFGTPSRVSLAAYRPQSEPYLTMSSLAGFTLDDSTDELVYDGTGSVGQFAITVDSAAAVFGWTIPDVPLALNPSEWSTGSSPVSGVGATYDLSQYADHAGTTPVYSITSGGGTGISINASTGLLTVGPTTAAASYSVTVDLAENSAEADWALRSQGDGVVWAHDFRYAAELTNFLGAGTDVRNNGVMPRINTTDGPTGNCLEYVALGARLTANFGLSATTMSLDDTTHWPDGNFYFHLFKTQIVDGQLLGDQQNNLFYCPANNGSTQGRFGNELRGVQYDSQYAGSQPFAASRRAWVVGDIAGHHVSQTWTRPFCAFASPGNGLPSPDVNNAGVVQRTWSPIATTPANVYFGYGWYGHPTHQSEFPAWTPQGGTLKTAPWDGEEFYLQFRVQIDPRFWQYNYPGAIVGQADTDSAWGHKFFFIQSQQTVPQQLVGMILANNRYSIPSTPTAPWQWYTTQAGRTLATNLDGSGSYQPGSQWQSTAIYGVSNQPAGSAWEWYTDEWLTVLIRVKPGLHWNRESNPTASGVRNSLLEVKIARAGQDYVTVFSQSDQALTYGSTSDSQGEWFNALPGYSAFMPTMYLNTDLGNPPPVRAYYHRFAQIIFSKQSIPAPAAGA
jgi:hypothetical protein